MKKVILLILLVGSLFGESRYVCTIKQIYDAYTLKTFDRHGLEAIDTMVFTLQNDVLTHNYKDSHQKDKQVKYFKNSNGKTTMYPSSGIKEVAFVEYQTNSSTPVIIYSLDNFEKLIRVNLENTGTYGCTKF